MKIMRKPGILVIHIIIFILLNPQGCVKVAQNVTFPGRHGDLPLRELVGATLCGRPDLRNLTLTQSWLNPGWSRQNQDNYREILFKMKERFKEIKTYCCIYEMFTANEERNERVVCDYFFKAPKMVRMELLKGKYKGTVMLYLPHKVRLKLGRGIFSLFSFRYHPNHKWVSNLRGYGLHQSDWGWYIDRHIQMLELTGAIFSGEEVAAGRETIKYKLISKDPARTNDVAEELLWIDRKEFIPVKYVQYNIQGKILMSGLYTDIRLNVELDDRLFKKFK